MCSPAALTPRASTISNVSTIVSLCPKAHINSPFEGRVVHGHSGGVLPGPISNPEVKPSCVDSGTVVRKPTGKVVAVPLSFTFSPHTEMLENATLRFG